MTGFSRAEDSSENEAPSRLFRSVKGVIFDFDGTLFDYGLIAFNLIAAYPLDALRIWKERLTRKRFAGCDYKTPENYYKVFFEALARLSFTSPERIRNWYFQRYMPRMVRVLKKHYKFRPGVEELFGNCNKPGSLRVSVYSDYPFLKERMQALGWVPDGRIMLYGSDSFGAQKPAPRPFLDIAANMGLNPDEILVIGDRDETDGMGAFNAGMRFFSLETGRRRYFRLDPYRRRMRDKLCGPSLVMYAGRWDDVIDLLTKNIKNRNF